MQEVFVETFSYGFSWDGAKIIILRALIFIYRPDKTLMQQIRYCSTGVDFDLCGRSYYVANARVGQQAQGAVI